MKRISLLLVALGLAFVLFHEDRLTQLQTELAVVREQARVAERQRVPKAEYARALGEAEAAQDRVAGLEKELAGIRQQLVAAQDQSRAAEARLNLAANKTPETPATTDLVKGSFTLLDDTRVYSPDALLKVGNNVLISSPTGLMLSDREIATVAGDLAVETPGGTMQAAHAFIDVNNGKIEMTADSMTFTNK